MNIGVVGNPRYADLQAILRLLADVAPKLGITLYTDEGLEQLWPKERRFVDEANGGALAGLAVNAGAAFPQALAIVRDYIRPRSDGRLHLYEIKSSAAPKAHPRETLDLLWALCGTVGDTSYDMPGLLDLLVEADEALAVDRRLQSLEQRSKRF